MVYAAGVPSKPAPPVDPAAPVDYVCEHCGATGVTRDAWAEWNTTDQRWHLTTAFDFAFCHQCHRPTRLIASPLRKG